MALKNKNMTPDEALMLRDTHRQVWEAMEGQKNYTGIYNALITIAGFVTKFNSFVGPISNVTAAVDIIWGVANRNNTAINISALRGAEKQFDRVRNRLINGGYRAAQVQMNWIKYPSVSNNHEFVQGNNSNPALGYKILRLQRSDGTWIDAP